MRAKLFITTLTTATVLTASVAHADEAMVSGTSTHSVQSSAPAKAMQTTPQLKRPAWQADGSLGWFVIATSVFVGTGLTGFGLGQTCDDPFGVNACTRGTSMALWGGIGIAALGSAIGLVILQKGRARTSNQTFATVKLGPLGDFRLIPAL